MSIKHRYKNGTIVFSDYPDFKPNLTPREMFDLGSFGGTYWRPIYSSITNKDYKNPHLEFPKSWWKDIPDKCLTSSECDITLNKYGVRVGTSLDFWESKGWIVEQDPYGWVQWYCRFYMGRRSPDDKRQISRWKRLAGKNGRFRRQLISLIRKRNSKWNDFKVSPKIRQTLQHWGYVLTKAHFDKQP